MSIECLECGCDDQSLSCLDPRTPPLSLDVCLCASCGETAYRDVLQDLFDQMENDLSTSTALELVSELIP